MSASRIINGITVTFLVGVTDSQIEEGGEYYAIVTAAIKKAGKRRNLHGIRVESVKKAVIYHGWDGKTQILVLNG